MNEGKILDNTGILFQKLQNKFIRIFFLKKRRNTYTHSHPSPPKKKPTVQDAVREGSEQDAGEGGKRRQ